jgi:tRNA(Ile)-lysidine synthase
MTLGLAVSGGPDSLALLLLAAAARPGAVEAATVDHGLRPESAAEADMVAEVCHRLGVAHSTLRVTVSPGNLQDEARQARYTALGEWAKRRGIYALATAHHADDQAETMMMRLNRASGLAGLAGVRPLGSWPQTGLMLLRPLLGWRKAELAAIIARAGISAADDRSNTNPKFDRARVRRALAGADWIDPAALARSAAHLSEAEDALNWAAFREWDERVLEDDYAINYRPVDAPRAIRLRILERAVAQMGGREVRGGALARLADELAGGGKATIGGVIVEVVRGVWRFTPEQTRRLH